MIDEILEDREHQLLNNNNKPSPWKTGIKWGIIGGLGLIVYSLMSYVLKENVFKAGLIDFLILFILLVTPIVLSQKEHKVKELYNEMSYGRALGIGTIVALIAGILLALWNVVLYHFIISPEELEQGVQFTVETTIEMMEKIGAEMTDEMVELQESETRKGFRPTSQIISGTLMKTFIGFIISLITSIFTKQN